MIFMKLLLYRGTGWISRIIKWQSRGPYSHVAIMIDGGAIYEAREFKGVRRFTKPIIGDIDIFQVNNLTMEQEREAEQFLLRQVGKKYDYTMVMRFITRRNETRKSSGKWFCSELAAAVCAKINAPLFANTEPWEVPPSWIHRSLRVSSILP